jgi:subtilisin family serine protease
MFEKAVRQGTIAVPASSPNLIAVGCTVNRLGWDPLKGAAIELASLGGETNLKPDSMCYFSAAGPNPFGVPKPDISAPGGFVAAAMSQDADPRTKPGGLFDGPGCPADQRPCYVVDQTHALTSGTSMAAPHVTGAIALLFELDLKERGAMTLTQAGVTDLLQAGARWPTGTVRHETQLGPGTLDVEGSRRAYYEDQVAQAPSAEKSWWILSSAYARPDLSWPVMGTVELRQDNGEVVTGIAGSQLDVSVTGGVLVQPVTKVKNGLFRFAVAGEPGSAGTKMTVDVRYAGRSIETPRELPIGEDIWRANGTFGATSGGCGLPDASTSSRSGPLGPTIGVALAGVVGLARRKRSSAKKQGR